MGGVECRGDGRGSRRVTGNRPTRVGVGARLAQTGAAGALTSVQLGADLDAERANTTDQRRQYRRIVGRPVTDDAELRPQSAHETEELRAAARDHLTSGPHLAHQIE